MEHDQDDEYLPSTIPLASTKKRGRSNQPGEKPWRPSKTAKKDLQPHPDIAIMQDESNWNLPDELIPRPKLKPKHIKLGKRTIGKGGDAQGRIYVGYADIKEDGQKNRFDCFMQLTQSKTKTSNFPTVKFMGADGAQTFAVENITFVEGYGMDERFTGKDGHWLPAATQWKSRNRIWRTYMAKIYMHYLPESKEINDQRVARAEAELATNTNSLASELPIRSGLRFNRMEQAKAAASPADDDDPIFLRAQPVARTPEESSHTSSSPLQQTIQISNESSPQHQSIPVPAESYNDQEIHLATPAHDLTEGEPNGQPATQVGNGSNKDDDSNSKLKQTHLSGGMDQLHNTKGSRFRGRARYGFNLAF